MLDTTLYNNQFIKVEIEESQIPWLKIFSQQPAKEFSHCNTKTKQQIWQALDIIETEMLNFFNCDKWSAPFLVDTKLSSHS